LFAAATDLTCPDVVIAREAIRVMAAVVRIFIVVVTLFDNRPVAISLGQYSFGAALVVALLIINSQKGLFLRRILPEVGE